MMNRFPILVAALLIFAGAPSAVAGASASAVYDTVDAVSLGQSVSCTSSLGCWTHTTLSVTGILKGQTTPTSRLFDFGDQAEIAAHCQRLAMIVMAKPGKYRYGIGTDEFFTSVNHGNGACSLTLVNP